MPVKNASVDTREYLSEFEGKLFFGLVLLPFIMWLWPSAVPFGFFEFWKIRGAVSDWFISAWPMFMWGAGVTIIILLITRSVRFYHREAGKIIVRGAIESIFAGVVEELTFRWLFFLSNIVLMKIGNFIFFGFLGFGIAEWLHLNIFGPLANFTTLRKLEPYLFHETGWAVGAALLASNAFFRDGHRYQGILGVLNSWFLGMYLFWIMFNYGLIVAVLVHFLYDFLISAVESIDAII